MRNLRSPSVQVALCFSMFATVAAIYFGSDALHLYGADTPKPATTLSEFMRKKLDASSLILEGLTTEDAQLIERGANELTQLSKAEKWNILTDSEYRAHSMEFRSNVKKLAEAAEKGNFDNAALQWFDTMKSCIECHQHVRNERATKK